MRLVNHQYHPTADRTGVRSYSDDKNHASTRQACRHIRVPVNVTCHCIPIQTVTCFIKLSPNATDGKSIDLLPNDGAGTSTGSEVIRLKGAKSQKRQTANKKQRQ